MSLDAKIEVTELKIVALGKAQSELMEELEMIKKQKSKPAPPVRRDLKKVRMQEVENFYTKRKLKRAI